MCNLFEYCGISYWVSSTDVFSKECMWSIWHENVIFVDPILCPTIRANADLKPRLSAGLHLKYVPILLSLVYTTPMCCWLITSISKDLCIQKFQWGRFYLKLYLLECVNTEWSRQTLPKPSKLCWLFGIRTNYAKWLMIYPVPKIIKSYKKSLHCKHACCKNYLIWYKCQGFTPVRPLIFPKRIDSSWFHLHAEASTVDPGSQAYYIPIR